MSFFKHWRILPLLLLSFSGMAAGSPSDTVALWAGYKVPHGKEVTLYAYRPEKPNGIGIIVCPGGSYFWLDKKAEGELVGEWLRAQGITAFVLHYRTAGHVEVIRHARILLRGKRHPDMICDAQRALQHVRDNADGYGIDAGKVGMMGFSAGGHLVMSAACFHAHSFIADAGIRSQASLRPAFVAPIYPVVTMQPPYVHRRSRRGLLGDNRIHDMQLRDSLSLERHIPADCPPVFLLNCQDDPIVPYQNSELLDSALCRKGIPHVYIQYEKGKHGFGASEELGSPESRGWKEAFLAWLAQLF
ncbi:MAG: alpha/beta hydrolase [Bacteroidales bacterium]|nr:alpha/beta hydrolase [Bacteroidales bacterium]